ncbi:MAG TPA: DUF4105 domain-containing protein [Gemmatimonadales bacterium]|nr:DUF4105 domain-containing protein [Gemmatimonadales bacterium]
MRRPGAAAIAMRVACAIHLLAACWPAAGEAQAAPPSRELKVFLMTFGPGRQVWERFGHNAIWIHDPADSTDLAFNYGLFDFHQHNFLLRFARGQMWYWMAGYPASAYIDQYERDNRSIWIQELELPPRAKIQLEEFLRWNALPEHRYYHYDYYRDNCSTRVRDAIDRALNGAFRRQTDTVPAHTTYRFHTQRLTTNDPLIFTALLGALGPGVDRPISAWEEMFLPLEMRQWVRTVTVPGPDGRPLPLVRSERTIFESTLRPPPDSPPNWVPWYLLMGLSIGGIASASARPARRSPAARYGFLIVTGSWLVLAGLAGAVLGGLWGLTDHVMAYRNQNLLQLDPLALALVPAAFSAVRSGTPAWGVKVARLVVALSLAGLALKLIPAWTQVNGSIIALALPAHLGVAAALTRLASRP